MKTIEVDPRVPGIRDEIPFPQVKQCFPELDFPSCQFSSPFSQKLQRLQEKLIVTIKSSLTRGGVHLVFVVHGDWALGTSA